MRGQDSGFPGPYQVTGVHKGPVYPAGERRPYLRVSEVEPGQVSAGLCLPKIGLGGIPLETPIVNVGLGRPLLLQQLCESKQFGFSIGKLGLGQGDGGLGLLKIGLIGILLN